MPSINDINNDTPWFQIKANDKDWESINKNSLIYMLEQLFIIRSFEEKLLYLKNEDLLHGPAHASIGQEGAAVGTMSLLSNSDKINGTHRMHHQFLAKALNYSKPKNYNPISDDFPKDMDKTIYTTMAEILGLSPGFNGGRGGSMHLKWDAVGALGSNAIVGGNPPHAVGYAFADKLKKSKDISVTFFGDGAMQMGSSYESMNLAALYELPVIFFCENNLYAVATHVREQTKEVRLSSRGVGLKVPSIQVDGMDPISVRLAVEWSKKHILEKGGPVLIEALTYRFLHQSGPIKGSAFGYRTKEEETEWQLKDPLLLMQNKLQSLKIINQEETENLKLRSKEIIQATSEKFLESIPNSNKSRIIPSLWPSTETVEHGIRGNLKELDNINKYEIEDFDPAELSEVKFGDVISKTMLSNMEDNETIFVLGEDVQHLKGGTAGATRGINQKFPNRIVGTPICENGFTGLAVGAALNGLRPVVEIMYPDFALVAADQLFNQASKVRHMFGGDFDLPLVVRSRVSAGTGYGSQHSMDASGLFVLYPGWRILVPSNPFDYIGLMNAALKCNDPVLVVEYNDLFQNKGLAPIGKTDFIVPIGKAKVVKEGDQCTILSYGVSIMNALSAAEELGVNAEIIDLRTIDLMGIDWDLIGDSIKKTNRVMIAEQTTKGTSLGSHISSLIHEKYFDWLDGEVIRVSGTNSSPVVSKVLEEAALAGKKEFEVGIQKLLNL